MKTSNILFLTILSCLFFFASLKLITENKVKGKYPCTEIAPKNGWNTDSSQFCGDLSKHKLNSLYDCAKTEVYKKYFGYLWFYCYPDASDKKAYYRIEMRACIGADSNGNLQRGDKFNSRCNQPVIESHLRMRTKCKVDTGFFGVSTTLHQIFDVYN